MNKTIVTEKLMLVLALAIAMSLLASACGPSKIEVKPQEGSTTAIDSEAPRTEREKNLEAIKTIQQITTQDIKNGTAAPIDVSASQDFANRMASIKFQSHSEDVVSLKTKFLTKDEKAISTEFIEPTFDEDKKIIVFDKNISTEEINGDNIDISLSLSARVQRLRYGRNSISITEKTLDAKKVEKKSTVNAIVRLNSALQQIQSKEDLAVKMKDATINTRITQLFVFADNSVFQDTQFKDIKSEANKIVININFKSGSTLSLHALNAKTSKIYLNAASDEATKKLLNNYDLELNAGDAIINADKVSIKITNKKTKAVSNITLTLVDSTTSKKADQPIVQPATPSAQPQPNNQAPTVTPAPVAKPAPTAARPASPSPTPAPRVDSYEAPEIPLALNSAPVTPAAAPAAPTAPVAVRPAATQPVATPAVAKPATNDDVYISAYTDKLKEKLVENTKNLELSNRISKVEFVSGLNPKLKIYIGKDKAYTFNHKSKAQVSGRTVNHFTAFEPKYYSFLMKQSPVYAAEVTSLVSDHNKIVSLIKIKDLSTNAVALVLYSKKRGAVEVKLDPGYNYTKELILDSVKFIENTRSNKYVIGEFYSVLTKEKNNSEATRFQLAVSNNILIQSHGSETTPLSVDYLNTADLIFGGSGSYRSIDSISYVPVVRRTAIELSALTLNLNLKGKEKIKNKKNTLPINLNISFK